MQMFYLRIQTEQNSLTRKSRTLFSLVPNIFKTSVLPLAFIVYLMAALAAGWMGPAAAHWGKHYSLQCVVLKSGLVLRFFIHRQRGQYFPLALGTGVFKYGITTAVQVLLMHLAGTGGWVSLYYLPHRVKESVVHAALVYQYFFHMQNLNAFNHCQTSR